MAKFAIFALLFMLDKISGAIAKCGRPPEVAYASNDAPSLSGDFDVGTLLNYSCVQGYYRFESRGLPKAKCMVFEGSARWFGPDIKCRARSCPPPADLLNGIRNGDLFQFPHIVKYRCVYGFELQGSAVRKCQANGRWSGLPPSCVALKCPKPTDPLQGRVLGTTLDYQSRVTYHCADGYRLVGQVQRVCQADGAWSGIQPTCEEIRCPILVPLWNGYMDGEGTAFEATIFFRCLEGMTHLGPAYTKCLEDGRWSNPVPQCMAPCQLPRIEAGRVERFNGSQLIYHGERIQVACDSDHELEVPDYPMCNNGTWSHIPRCVPVRCKSWPDGVRNARVVFAKSQHNSQARYQCSPGYYLKGNAIVRCLYGKWTGELPICETKICPHPEEELGSVAHGQIMLEGVNGMYPYAPYIRSVTEGRHISFQCERGYRIAGPPRATCVYGHWKPSVQPRCVRQTHPLLQGDIVWDRATTRRRRHTNGLTAGNSQRACAALPENRKQQTAVIRAKQLPGGSFAHQSQVMLLCRSGYALAGDADGVVTCVDGAWAPDEPVCRPKSCELPRRFHSFYLYKSEILRSGDSLRHREGARLICLRGYALVGNDVLECSIGKWTRDVGRCVPESCPVPFLHYGYYELSPLPANISHGTEVAFSCGRNLMPRPRNAVVVCAFGTLRPHAPECNREDRGAGAAPTTEFGCLRPLDIDEAWVYRQYEHAKRVYATLIDPYQDVYPNSTVVHYKCPQMGDRQREPAPLSEAAAVRCIDGEWIAQLIPCAPRDDPPSGVLGNSAFVNEIQERNCSAPDLSDKGGLAIVQADTSVLVYPSEGSYVHGASLQVACVAESNINEQQWQIKCRNGSWRRLKSIFCPHATAESNSSTTASVQNSTGRSCLYRNRAADMHVFSPERSAEVRFDSRFNDGDRLWMRCTHVGLFAFNGSRELVCRRGRWRGIVPSCIRLDPAKPDEGPPAVLYGVSQGHVSLSPRGELIARTTTSLYLDCLSPKRDEALRWKSSSAYRVYPRQWTRVALGSKWRDPAAPSEMDSRRLTITTAQPSDSGVFHCVGPRGHHNSIRLRVEDMECPLLAAGEGLVVRLSHARPYLGATAHFTCVEGHRLVGEALISCIEPGVWSHPMPTCSAIECDPVAVAHSALRAAVSHTAFRGVARFNCAPGYAVAGAAQIHCLATGRWSDPPPTCKVVSCAPPDLPLGAHLVEPRANYTYGDVVIFACADGFMQAGRDFAICTSDGQWDAAPPECIRYCRFAGRLANGATTAVAKDYYLVGERLVYYCRQTDLALFGKNVLECGHDGRWSAAVPRCLPKRPSPIHSSL